MKDLLLPLLHLAVTAAKLCRPGGVRAVIAENLLLKQQLIVLRRSRQRAPNLRVGDRLLCGFGALFLSPGRIRKVAIGLRPSTLLTFHQALVRGKYRRLFSSSARPKKPGPQGAERVAHPGHRRAQIAQSSIRVPADCAHHLADVRGRPIKRTLRDLERKLADFQAYYNAARSHASLDGHTPFAVASGHPVARADLNNIRWASHCRDLVQLPAAA